jgi:hypothetical protein
VSTATRSRLPLVTDEPAVLTWMIALAPQRRAEPVGRHWWRELVTEAWSAALHAWWLEREAAAIGYATEQAEFEAQHPRPRLRDFMVHLSHGRIAPETIL